MRPRCSEREGPAVSRCFSRSFGYLAILSLLLITVPGPLGQASAASDDDDQAPSKLTLAKKSLQEQNYEAAIAELMALHQQDSKDADVLNLLGFAHRKLGRFDQAEDYYLQALAVDPEHRGANEYLGELYLQTDRLDKAEERLAVLDDACFFPCSEYTDLKEEIENYKAGKTVN
jgi:tetratricopeptide (TPR) repeat protein